MKKVIALVLAGVMALSLAACGGSAAPAATEAAAETQAAAETKAAETKAAETEAPAAAEPTTVSVSLCNNPATLNNWGDTRVWIYYFTDMMNGYLTMLNADGSDIEPDIATDWTFSEDGLQIVFNLRDDVVFHNGRAMTADDVAWSINYQCDEANAAAQYSSFGPYVDHCEVTGDYQVTLFMKEPRPAIIESLSYVAILPEECMADMDRNPVGCGAYKFVQWDENQQIVMEKFDQYYKADEIKTDRIVFKLFNDYNAELSAFLAGEVQVMTQLANVDIPTIEAQADKYHFSTSEGNKYFVNWNMATDIAQNEKLREAVKLGVDRAQIVATAFAGKALATWEFPATTSYWYYPDLEYASDIEKAKQLVAESGYDGTEINFIYPNTTAEGAIGTVVAQQLANIGLNVKQDKIDSAAFMEVWNGGKYDLAICGFGAKLDPANLYTGYTSTHANYATRYHYKNEKYDELVAEANKLSDTETRYNMYKEAMTLFMDDAFLDMLISETTTSAISNDVEGYVYRNGGRPDYAHIVVK